MGMYALYRSGRIGVRLVVCVYESYQKGLRVVWEKRVHVGVCGGCVRDDVCVRVIL